MGEAITSLLRSLAKVATKLNPEKVSEGEAYALTESRFGGEPYAEIGESWPNCPTCKTPLTFICQIDTTSGFHPKPKGIDLFTFFYCWECGPWGMNDDVKGTWVVRTYLDPKDTDAEPIQPDEPEPYPPDACLLLPEKVLSFPDYDELDFHYEAVAERFSDNEDPWDVYEAAVKSLGGQTDFCTLVGGYPHWIQGDDTPLCDHCQNRMSLLTQIDSEPDAEVMWGDSGCLYIFYCANHPREVDLRLQCF